MYRSREQLAGQFGLRGLHAPRLAGSPALALAPTAAGPTHTGPTHDLIRRGPRKDLRQLAHEWRYEHLPALREFDWVPDLAIDIGSAQWFRGLGTMVGLSVAALLFWPDFSAVEAAPTMQLDTTSRDEFRSQMIMPLALGGDSGRRMGATAAVVPLGSVPERPTIQLTATLGQGDSFGRMLQRAGVGADEAARITQMVSARVPLTDIAAGTRFDLTLGRRTTPDRPRPVDDLAFRARFDLDLAVQRNGGALALVARPIAVDATPLRIKGIVGSSLYRSARAAGAPAAAIQQYIRTLDQHINLEQDLMPSDEFDIVIGYKRAASGEVEAGELLFAGVARDGKPRTQLLRWGGSDASGAGSSGQFYEASGFGRQQAGLGAPVAGRMTSGFGMRRHPILGYARMHAGLDFAAGYGAPIYATSDGLVRYAGRHGGHGNYVRLEHGGGIGTGYAHMSRMAVSPGMRVRRGQVIGYVGSTGLSTGPHLHYELYRGGRAVNPGSVQFIATAQLEGPQLAAFRARLAALSEVKPGAALASLAPARASDAPLREIDRLSDASAR